MPLKSICTELQETKTAGEEGKKCDGEGGGGTGSSLWLPCKEIPRCTSP